MSEDNTKKQNAFSLTLDLKTLGNIVAQDPRAFADLQAGVTAANNGDLLPTTTKIGAVDVNESEDKEPRWVGLFLSTAQERGQTAIVNRGKQSIGEALPDSRAASNASFSQAAVLAAARISQQAAARRAAVPVQPTVPVLSAASLKATAAKL